MPDGEGFRFHKPTAAQTAAAVMRGFFLWEKSKGGPTRTRARPVDVIDRRRPFLGPSNGAME